MITLSQNRLSNRLDVSFGDDPAEGYVEHNREDGHWYPYDLEGRHVGDGRGSMDIMEVAVKIVSNLDARMAVVLENSIKDRKERIAEKEASRPDSPLIPVMKRQLADMERRRDEHLAKVN